MIFFPHRSTSNSNYAKGRALAPFRLCVPKELMEVGYYCGFGGLNAQGFGMVKVADARDT